MIQKFSLGFVLGMLLTPSSGMAADNLIDHKLHAAKRLQDLEWQIQDVYGGVDSSY